MLALIGIVAWVAAADPPAPSSSEGASEGASAPAAAAASTSSSSQPAGPASLVDRVVTKSLLDDKKAAQAKKVMPSAKVDAKVAAPSDAAADLKKGEALLAKKDAKGALLAFRRALAKEPKSAAPLWGISRAADAAKDDATARRYAGLYVKSTGADRDVDTAAAAQWRLEQPDDSAPALPAKSTQPGRPGFPGSAPASPVPGQIPTSAGAATTPPAPL